MKADTMMMCSNVESGNITGSKNFRSAVIRTGRLWLLAIFAGGAISVAAQPAPGGSRGELLYSTHCIACHTTEIHWRERKLVTDWSSLKSQVFRWQSNTGLSWTDGDIAAVTSYLNELYYRFPAPGAQAALEPPLQRASTR